MDSLSASAEYAPLPVEAPLEMPVQSLRAAPGRSERPASSPAGIGWRRAFLFGVAVLLTVAAAHEMYLVLAVNGLTALGALVLAMFVALFAWIALSFASALGGFVSLLRGGDGRLGIVPGATLPKLCSRTALLMPTYNEQPARVAAGLLAMQHSIAACGASSNFDFFILSDTTDPDVWIAEEAMFLELRDRFGSEGNIFYRHRPDNAQRKAGNIADWVRRFGAAYPQMLILDADSVMTGDIIIRIVSAMERHPDVGLIQTLPIIVNGISLFARMQQFAGRVYGPLIAHGIAAWHGAEGNYWGHNAVIRTRAFAEQAGLPELGGRKPFGGHIMSHDFVEAALMRRGGWAIHMVPALHGSYEESPPSLIDLAVRDRRWCQGNLQHAAVLPARGLNPVSRLHMLMGIGSYVTAPMWLIFLLLGVLISLQARFITPDYFPAVGRSLFPNWPVVDPIRSMWVFVGTMGLLLAPKLLSWLALMVNPQDRRGCGGALRSLLSVLIETVLAGIIAPVTMLVQSLDVAGILLGRDAGWQTQRRGDGSIPLRQVCQRFVGHTTFGIVLGIVAYLVSPSLAAWMSPVVVGLVLTIPLATTTGSSGPGVAARRLGLLQIPEEVSPPEVLTEAAKLLRSGVGGEPADGVARLAGDPRLLKAHLEMLPPPRRKRVDPINPALLIGMAKLAEAPDIAALLGSLTRAEKAQMLANAEGVHGVMALLRETKLPRL